MWAIKVESTTLTTSSGEAAPGAAAAISQVRALRRRWWGLLVLSLLLAGIPFLLPQHATESVPRFAFVVYYSVLSLFVGWFGISWIFQTARLINAAEKDSDRHLVEDARQDAAPGRQGDESRIRARS
jgi:hypothetical protein